MNLGVLISGRGTNLQALIDACALPDYPAKIAVVISNNPEAASSPFIVNSRLPSMLSRPAPRMLQKRS